MSGNRNQVASLQNITSVTANYLTRMRPSVNVPFLFGNREITVSDKASDTSPTFEQSLSELEQIVSEMERGDLPLHEALKKFERGVALSRLSQQALSEAEQKVKILTEQGNTATLQDFNPDDEL